MTNIEISVIGLGAAFGGFFIQYLKYISDANKDKITLMERIKGLEVKFELFWAIIQKEVPKMLISPHTPEIDTLLLRFQHNNLDIEELEKLKELVRCELPNVISMDKKLGFIFVLARIDQLIMEGGKR